MRHQQRLQKFMAKTRFAVMNSAGTLWKKISFFLAVTINLLILMCYQEGLSDDDMQCSNQLLENYVAINILFIIQGLGVVRAAMASWRVPVGHVFAACVTLVRCPTSFATAANLDVEPHRHLLPAEPRATAVAPGLPQGKAAHPWAEEEAPGQAPATRANRR